jgi:hypothetical protein
MSASNTISAIVATCFVVFIGLGSFSQLYYEAKVRDSVPSRQREKATIPFPTKKALST